MRPLVEALNVWLRQNRANLSAKVPGAKAIDYLLMRWPAFTRFLGTERLGKTARNHADQVGS